MTIQSDYGTVEYEENDLLVFRDGIFGFPKLTRYLLLRMNDDDDSILLMLSVEDTSVAFVLFDPFALCCLGAKDSEELSYYVICVVQTDYMENTVNLKCPLVINPETRHGIQVILANSHYEYRHKLRSFPSIVDQASVPDPE